jgi:hypothetical protein
VTVNPPDKPGKEIAEIDVKAPNAARTYNYALGGTANFEADRVAAQAAAAAYPGGWDAVQYVARTNRDFLGRAVRFMAGEGIRQFLDLGTGVPDDDNVHAVAQQAAPESRVVCVDYDPVVLAHAHDLMQSTPEGEADFLNGDFRYHEPILRDAAATIDFDRPVGILLIALLHLFRDEDEPYTLVQRYLDAVPSGSCLAVTHLTDDLVPMAGLAERINQSMVETMVLRPHAEIVRFFDGLDVVDPGVVPVDQWRPDTPPKGDVVHYAAVARKP